MPLLKSIFNIISPFFVWSTIIILPMTLTYQDNYRKCFEMREIEEYNHNLLKNNEWEKTPPVLGLLLGLSAVAIGHIFVIVYFLVWKLIIKSGVTVQKEKYDNYKILEALKIRKKFFFLLFQKKKN